MELNPILKVIRSLDGEDLEVTYSNMYIAFGNGKGAGGMMPCHDPQNFHECDKCGRQRPKPFFCCDHNSVDRDRVFWQLIVSRESVLEILENEMLTTHIHISYQWTREEPYLVFSDGQNIFRIAGKSKPATQSVPETEEAARVAFSFDLWDKIMAVSDTAAREWGGLVTLELSSQTHILKARAVNSTALAYSYGYLDYCPEWDWVRSISWQFFEGVNAFIQEYRQDILERSCTLILRDNSIGVYFETTDSVEFLRVATALDLKASLDFYKAADRLAPKQVFRVFCLSDLLRILNGVSNETPITLSYNPFGLVIKYGDEEHNLECSGDNLVGQITVQRAILLDCLRHMSRHTQVMIKLPASPQELMELTVEGLVYSLGGIYVVTHTLAQLKRKGNPLAKDVILADVDAGVALVATEDPVWPMPLDEKKAIFKIEKPSFIRLLSIVLSCIGMPTPADEIESVFIKHISSFTGWAYLDKEAITMIATCMHTAVQTRHFKDLICNKYDDGIVSYNSFMSVYTLGYMAGRLDGQKEGYAEGYRDGEQDGYRKGYVEGRKDAEKEAENNPAGYEIPQKGFEIMQKYTASKDQVVLQIKILPLSEASN